jgi:hypothetical protein
MKLLSKLSTPIKAMAHGPMGQGADHEPAPILDVSSPAHAALEPSSTVQEQALEEGRVADLLQRKLTDSDVYPHQREKGD